MILSIYAVKDKVAGFHFQPFCAAHDAVAVRIFGEACNTPDMQPYKSPQDYDLMCLGTFNDETGLYDTHEPKFVISAVKLHPELNNEIGNGSSI